MRRMWWALILGVAWLAAACGNSGARDGDTDSTHCRSSADCLGSAICDPDTGRCVGTTQDGDTAEAEVSGCKDDSDCPDNYTCQALDADSTLFACVELGGDSDYEGGEDADAYKCPKMEVSPTDTVDFQSVMRGNSVARNLTIANSSGGNVDLKVNGIICMDLNSNTECSASKEFTITGIKYNSYTNADTTDISFNEDWQINNGQSITIKRLDSITLTITYAPKDLGTDKAQLTILTSSCDASSSYYKVIMESDYKGQPDISVYACDDSDDQETIMQNSVVSFGDVAQGGDAKYKTFCVKGLVGESDNRPLEVYSISTRDLSDSFTILSYDSTMPLPTSRNSWELYSEEPMKFVVRYVPSRFANWANPIESMIEIFNSSYLISHRYFDFNITGQSTTRGVGVFPSVIDFGDVTDARTVHCLRDGLDPSDPTEGTPTGACPRGQICYNPYGAATGSCRAVQTVMIYNYLTDNDIQVKGIDFKDPVDTTQPCEEDTDTYEFSEDIATINTTVIGKNGQTPLALHLMYKAATNAQGLSQYQKCKMHIVAVRASDHQATNNDGYLYEVDGRSLPKNVPPIANISTGRYSPPIDSTLSAKTGDTLCFYGYQSYDPDHVDFDKCGHLHFYWTWPTKPDGASDPTEAGLTRESCDDGTLQPMKKCFTFTTQGDYTLSLRVVDSDGESTSAQAQISVRGNEGLKAYMTFNCGSASVISSIYRDNVNVDLIVTDTNDGRCSGPDSSSSGQCPFFAGGIGVMSEYQTDCQSGVNYEIFKAKTSTLNVDLPDGTYTIQAKYVNDCQSWITIFSGPFCELSGGELENNAVKIELYDANSTSLTPFAVLSGSLEKTGSILTWCLNRVNGMWDRNIQECHAGR